MTFNVLDPEVRANPNRLYARLRAEPGVHRVEPFGHYLIARYADVTDVLQRVDDFSSLEMARQMGPVGEIAHLLGRNVTDMPPTIISSDNPAHDRLRKIMQGRFTPRAVAKIEGPVRRLTEQLVAKLERAGEFDLVREFTIPLPVIVIAQMLGIDESRFEDFKRWSDALVRVVGASGAERQRYQVEMLQLMQYIAEVAERRRADPGDDLISAVIGAEKTGQINVAEVLAYIVLLLVAGNETTTNLIGGMVEALLDNPGEIAKLRADRSLLTNAVEEGLRYCSPVQGLFRNATRDARVGGSVIPKDAPIMVCYAAANRDESFWSDPDRFDITRDTRGHVAFGRGLHFCLGANLARREARIALERLLPLLPRLRRTRAEREYVDSWFLRGPKSLPLALG